MYLLFLFTDRGGLGGLNDLEGRFETIAEAKHFTEEQPWYEWDMAEIVQIANDALTITLVCKGKRLGHHDESRIEWKDTKYSHLAMK